MARGKWQVGRGKREEASGKRQVARGKREEGIGKWEEASGNRQQGGNIESIGCLVAGDAA